ncbi:LysE family translocator [Mesorhizobium sp. M1312]
MTYLALVAASDGRRAGFATVAGVALGLAIIGVIAAVGVAEAIQASDLLYEGLRWAGVMFLLYLAWEGWISGTDLVAEPHEVQRKHFTRGLVTNLLNPKAGIFYVAVLPTFIDQSLPLMMQALTAIYVGVATFVHSAIVILAGALEPVLNDPRLEKIVRRFLSGVLAVVAIWFAYSTAR